jgi:hypothetical protein
MRRPKKFQQRVLATLVGRKIAGDTLASVKKKGAEKEDGQRSGALRVCHEPARAHRCVFCCGNSTTREPGKKGGGKKDRQKSGATYSMPFQVPTGKTLFSSGCQRICQCFPGASVFNHVLNRN